MCRIVTSNIRKYTLRVDSNVYERSESTLSGARLLTEVFCL